MSFPAPYLEPAWAVGILGRFHDRVPMGSGCTVKDVGFWRWGVGLRISGSRAHMGGCQNCGPFWGTLNTRCRIINRDP